ncbi:MAG: GNAT family N-acetyltransferase, partial [Verrucomicrobiota bacterium]
MEPFFVHVEPSDLAPEALDRYLELGWFRLGRGLFTTSHVDLGKQYPVRWLRYPLPALRDRASLRRLRRRSAHWRCSIREACAPSDLHEELYARYRASLPFPAAASIAQALFDGGEPADSPFRTMALSVFDRGRLIAGGYFDLGAVSGASIVHFYDPEWAPCSPGRQLILYTAEHLRTRGFQFYYPGYLLEGHPKMDYKLC